MSNVLQRKDVWKAEKSWNGKILYQSLLPVDFFSASDEFAISHGHLSTRLSWQTNIWLHKWTPLPTAPRKFYEQRIIPLPPTMEPREIGTNNANRLDIYSNCKRILGNKLRNYHGLQLEKSISVNTRRSHGSLPDHRCMCLRDGFRKSTTCGNSRGEMNDKTISIVVVLWRG